MAIKTIPEDFLVHEVLTDTQLRDIGPHPKKHAVYVVNKRNMSTPEACSKLAKTLGTQFQDVSAAGLKDTKAVTTQHLTVKLGGRLVARNLIEQPKGDNWKAKLIGYTNDALDASAILENRFQITLRGLTAEQDQQIDEHVRQLIPEQGATGPVFTNYFGNQRFSGSKATGFVAPLILQGQDEQALKQLIATPYRKDSRDVARFKRTCANLWGDWNKLVTALPRQTTRGAYRAPIEHLSKKPGDFRGAIAKLPAIELQMMVESYQSLLWNKIATAYITQNTTTTTTTTPTPATATATAENNPAEASPGHNEHPFDQSEPHVIHREDRLHACLFPYAQSLPPNWAQHTLPVLGHGTSMAEEPWHQAAKTILNQEGIDDTDDLQTPGLPRPYFPEIPRALFVQASHFQTKPAEKDERAKPGSHHLKRAMRFALPRGTYATVLLRALGQ